MGSTDRLVVEPLTPPELSRLRRKLLRQARLFDDPRSYIAGVEDAFDAIVQDNDTRKDLSMTPDPAA